MLHMNSLHTVLFPQANAISKAFLLFMSTQFISQIIPFKNFNVHIQKISNAVRAKELYVQHSTTFI